MNTLKYFIVLYFGETGFFNFASLGWNYGRQQECKTTRLRLLGNDTAGDINHLR